MKLVIRGALLAAAVSAAGFSQAPAAQAADYFKGKTIKISVGFGPGGGYDAYGRMLGRHWGQHIPGKPQVIVQNMPGASSLKAVQYLQEVAPKDGTAVVIFNFGQITNSIVNPSKTIKVDFRNFAWIGSMNRDVSVCYVWKQRFPAIKSASDLATAKQINYGLTGVGSASYFNQAILLGIFNAPLKQVKGYKGSKNKQIAIERGELDGDCGDWTSVPKDWEREGKITYLMKSSPSTPAGLDPSIKYAGDMASSDEKKRIVKLLSAAGEIGRPFITRKEVPGSNLKALRIGFDAAMKDPKLLADSIKTKRPISPSTAKEAQETLAELYAMPADVIAKAKTILPKGSKKKKKKKK
jgi:tripartite-type tricarboxylate transporter receptor subunit TctC